VEEIDRKRARERRDRKTLKELIRWVILENRESFRLSEHDRVRERRKRENGEREIVLEKK
jgi:hypothetical protein